MAYTHGQLYHYLYFDTTEIYLHDIVIKSLLISLIVLLTGYYFDVELFLIMEFA